MAEAPRIRNAEDGSQGGCILMNMTNLKIDLLRVQQGSDSLFCELFDGGDNSYLGRLGGTE